ncbi:MAG: S-methyl-5-thioribose-1-phosphate isomerase [SAR86 cluster bacterium]|uniref:Methylthioribose-1-phosphate isomerase n=1 Tax=SAR86 cluster bacterium TaxID=2030880 RepID=A0A2A5AWE7_9GAMM|nr:MAG: S-methyl-5-thioribose-1-phosphate isomerase [SAR86 cluster bacterium]
MNVNGKQYQSIWFDEALNSVNIIDQTCLPHKFETLILKTLEDTCHAIEAMQVRGAPLIGVAAAYGMYLALSENPEKVSPALERLLATRPTAVNLRWALERVEKALEEVSIERRSSVALATARELEREDMAICEKIGEHGATLLNEIWESKADKSAVLNVLTHCNAGALATVDWGTALSVIYKAAEKGIPVHVWVDETRPRNQGAALTCWELAQHGVSHTLIVDNAGGHLMQQGLVDCCVVGSDRTTITGDVCNKIGTYLKALAAHDNSIPFFVALPVSSIDFTLSDGVSEIPIEERSSEEVSHISGIAENGELLTVRMTVKDIAISNFAFDVTPARLISKIITEKGIFDAQESELLKLKT